MCHHTWISFNIFYRDGVSLRCPEWFYTPALKQSSHLGLPQYWDYRCEPPSLANAWFCFLLLFLRLGLALLSRLEYSGMISAHCILCLLSSSDSLAPASSVAGIIVVCHHSWLIFAFFVEMGFTLLARLVLNS